MDDFYTVNQTAIILKVHPLTIRRYIKEGKLKAFRVGGNVRISVGDLRNFTQNFVPHTKSPKSTQATAPQIPFSLNDPFFRLKSRGISLSKLEQE